ncbi:YolD-like family protein [Halalkalibacillus sediminis]|uniref:YolD-like family protein n=1 Tax=Halalkalibacillus sediminis TaxID=2018042 RepID=A0A2I0QWS6_9BACI|nr:YolD-like family protein [Halalkalibacillus sediminis]PKR78797.1 YolD-like family protein [Halalkalibacillus sediminis]
MHNDRGSIKWTSMMLPEHVSAIQKMWKEDTYQPPPSLDEQELELLNENLEKAIDEELKVKIIRYSNGKYSSYEGSVERYEAIKKELIIRNSSQSFNLPLHQIVDIRI